MRVILAVVGRNLRLFFRDRLNVFFSLLSALMLFGLYAFFLGKLQIDNLTSSFPGATVAEVSAFVDSWMFAGIVLTTTVSSGLGSLSILVDDRQSGRFRDILVSPVHRLQTVAGYLLSSATVTMILSTLVIAVAVLYLGVVDGRWLGVGAIAQIVGIAAVCSLAFTALSSFLVSFLKSAGAFSALSTIIGALIGFLAGAYIPVGALPVGVAAVVNALPFGQAAALFRQPFVGDLPLTLAGGNAAGAESIETIFGVRLVIGDAVIPPIVVVVILLTIAVIFAALATLRIRRLIR